MFKRAEMGIGTLIIFISMILVAAIAASVLIQTVSSLQNKALLTGERSKTQVSTNIMPVNIYAEDGSVDSSLDRFYIKAKLAPGSDPISVNDLLIEMSLKNESVDYGYNSTLGCDNIVGSSSTEKFGLDYLIRGDSFSSGYIQRGDVALLCFETPRSVGEDESISMSMIPKVGSPTIVEKAMPDIVTEKRVTLYP